MDAARRALAHDYARVLKSLARGATARGSAADALAWRRKLAALEPLNARLAVRLMEALAVAGDAPGAIRHARVYEVLLEQELDLPPDRGVAEFAERLRRDAALAAVTALALGERLSIYGWALYAPFDTFIGRAGLRSGGGGSRPPAARR